MAMFQVQMVNNVKTLVPISGSAATNVVESGNLNPVSSGAVDSAISSAVGNLIKYKDIEIVFANYSFVQYQHGGYYTNIPLSNFLSNYTTILAITTRWWTALDMRGFYLGFDGNFSEITVMAETYNAGGVVRARIVYI